MAEEIGELVEVPNYNSPHCIGPKTELVETSVGTVVKAIRQAGFGQKPVARYGLLERKISWEESREGKADAKLADMKGHTPHPYAGVDVYVVKHAKTDPEKAAIGNALILEHSVDRNEISFF